MAIAASKTREKYPLSRRKIIKKTFLSVIGWFVLYLIVFGAGIPLAGYFESMWNINIPTWIYSSSIFGGFIIFLIILGVNYLYQVLYFNSYYYEFSDSFIVIRKGVIMPTEISIPWERVQDVYVDQDLLDRILSIYDVHLSTATMTSGMEAHIDGVEKEAADGLKTVLLKTIGEKIHRKPTAVIQTTNEPPKH